MSTDTSIEQRLAAVECAVTELQQRLVTGRPTANWLDRFKGAFKDEPAFAEDIELGAPSGWPINRWRRL